MNATPVIRPPDAAAVARVVAAALAEDVAQGDPTSEGLFGPDDTCSAILMLKEPGVVCGMDIAAAVFAALDALVRFEPAAADGAHIEAIPAELAHVTGPTRAVLAGERTALNLLGHLSGIATLTARCVAEVAGTGATILDTRKTTAGLRDLEKYAVRCGGGTNHRFNLGEALLAKDSHKRLAGGVGEAAHKLRLAHPELSLEVEAETLDEVRAALEAGVDRILLDNMTPAQLRTAVGLCRGRARTEASGGITLANLHHVAETGVDFISLGALTHSARSIDFSLEVVV
jgi:nicotinate-nucleotide pyrophosphorylase (carboxylating)